MSKRFYTIDELVKMGVGSRSAIQRMIIDGTIPAIKLTSRRYIIPAEEFESILSTHRVMAKPSKA